MIRAWENNKPKELSNHPVEEKRRQTPDTVRGYPPLDAASDEIYMLSRAYLESGVIPATHVEDAVHLAAATVHMMDILASWNYKHIVKLETVKKIQSLNVLKGYRPLDIVTPLSL